MPRIVPLKSVVTSLMLCVCAQCWATLPTASLVDDEDFYLKLLDYTAFYIDENPNSELDDVLLKNDLFLPIPTPYINFGAVEDRHLWLRVLLSNDSPQTGRWRLDINRQYYENLDVFMLRGNEITHLLQQTEHSPYYERPIDDRMLGVDFSLAGQETVTVYVRVQTDTASFMPLAVGTVAATIKQHNLEHTLNWVLNGALLTCIAFTLMMMNILGWRIAVGFSLYMLAGTVYVIHSDGYTFANLWPGNMHWNDPMNLSLMVSMPIFGLLFVRELFNFKRNAPRFDRCLKVYIALALVVMLSSFHLFEVRALKIIGYLFTPIGSFFQLAAAVIAWRAQLLGAKPYLVGALLILCSLAYATLGHTFPGHFNLDTTLDVGHFALLTESLAFAAAISVRLVGLRNERNAALQAELGATRARLELSAKLQETQRAYTQARELAEARQHQLSDVSHDIRQPLASLRHSLESLEDLDEATAKQMHGAFDYLENLATSQLFHDSKERDWSPIDSSESFQVSEVLDNVHQIFSAEANKRGIDLRYRRCTATVTTNPIGLMRAVNNLVSNALQHSACKRVLLTARLRNQSQELRIEVWDSGKGMASQELNEAKERRHKQTDSQGQGLGLAIVQDFCSEHGYRFTLKSTPGCGTFAAVSIPV